MMGLNPEQPHEFVALRQLAVKIATSLIETYGGHGETGIEGRLLGGNPVENLARLQELYEATHGEQVRALFELYRLEEEQAYAVLNMYVIEKVMAMLGWKRKE